MQTRREKHWWSSTSARACSSGVSPFGGLGALGSHRPRPHPRHPFLLHAPRPSRSSLVHAPPRSDLSRLGTAPSIQLATNPLHNHIRHKLEHLGDHEVCIEQEIIEALVDVARVGVGRAQHTSCKTAPGFLVFVVDALDPEGEVGREGGIPPISPGCWS